MAVEAGPLAVGVDLGEGFAPAFKAGGLKAREDFNGGELAECGEAWGFRYQGVGVAGFKGGMSEAVVEGRPD